MKEFVALRAKPYAYRTDDDDEKKKAKGTKKCVIKRKLMSENFKDCLLNGKVILKSQQRLKSDHHKVYTEEVNKIALSSKDDKRLQTFNSIETYPYRTTNEMLRVFESKENVLKILMINCYNYVSQNKTEHNLPCIPDKPCRILIIGG